MSAGNINPMALFKAYNVYKQETGKGLSGSVSTEEYLRIFKHVKGIAPEKRKSFEFFKAVTVPANSTANIWSTNAPVGTVIATHYNVKIITFAGETDLLKVKFLTDEVPVFRLLTLGDFRDHASISELTPIHEIIKPAKVLRVECVNADPTNAVTIFALLKGYYYNPESL